MTGRRGAGGIVPPMMAYEELDAWKVCQDLFLDIRTATEPLLEREPDLAHRMRFVSLRAASRIARGTGNASRVSLARCAGAALNYLSELAFLLGMVRALGLMPDDQWCTLDALRGRATFYTGKVAFGRPPEPG